MPIPLYERMKAAIVDYQELSSKLVERQNNEDLSDKAVLNAQTGNYREAALLAAKG
jgi:hypothetical protein